MTIMILTKTRVSILCNLLAAWCYGEQSVNAGENIPRACGIHGVCHCHTGFFGRTEVNCRSRHLQSIPLGIPNNTIELDLSFNELRALPKNAFHELKSLERLDLDANDLTALPETVFHNLKSLETLDLSSNDLSFLPENVFHNLKSLDTLYLGSNQLSTIPVNVFEDLKLLSTLDLSYNKLSTLPNNVFENLESLFYLDMYENELTELPNNVFKGLSLLNELDLNNNKLRELPFRLFAGLEFLEILFLYDNHLTVIRRDSFIGLPFLRMLLLHKNKITVLEHGCFRGLEETYFLDLSYNSISQIPPGLFDQSQLDNLEVLFLQNNYIEIIHRDSFAGLYGLHFLCLFSNKIHVIENEAFLFLPLQYLYLFQNNLTNITGNPFQCSSLKQLHLYGNSISHIDTLLLMETPADAIIFFSCQRLNVLPRNPYRDNLKCVSSTSLPSIDMGEKLVMVSDTISKAGFNCTTEFFDVDSCTPCPVGTYGDTDQGGCKRCPVGGFYQDEVAQTAVPANSIWNIPCKICNAGTYVKDGKGASARDCEVCPEGTNQTIDAGFRACYCKRGYARTDRYGPCHVCVQEGIECSQDVQLLLPGYMWNWSFPGANLTEYKSLVENLRLAENIGNKLPNYTGSIPRVYKCPETENCPNDNDSIVGNCAVGYTGWLCTNCENGYYSVLSSCIPCPSLAMLIIECCMFFIVCVMACCLLSWQVKRTRARENQERSLVDIMLARIKILLGFYQVIGEIITSLHEINWSGSLVALGKIISTFEINILKVFVRPRCFDVKLDFHLKLQFIVGAISPMIIAFTPFLFYQTKKLYIRIRFTSMERMSYRGHFQNLKTFLCACVVALWFIIYPPVCSIIFSLYPITCELFSLDLNNKYNITRLRSDLDMDCAGLRVYHLFAFTLTGIYAIAFPLTLLFFLYKNYVIQGKQLRSENYGHTIGGEEGRKPSLPTDYRCLDFLSENYKRKFWYWEIIELARKVSQTLLVTLYGWEHRLTILLTIFISALFLLLHAGLRPMKSSYEQGLQMFSLTVIFLNVVIATNTVPDDQGKTISTILVLLDIIILLIIAGELVLTIAVHVKQIRIPATVTSFFSRRQRLEIQAAD